MNGMGFGVSRIIIVNRIKCASALRPQEDIDNHDINTFGAIARSSRMSRCYR